MIQNILTVFPEIPLKQESDWSRGGAYCLLERSLGESSVSQTRHGTLLNLDPSEAQQRLNEVQRIRGILRPGGFTLNTFLASVIHGAGVKRLDNHDSVFWLCVV